MRSRPIPGGPVAAERRHQIHWRIVQVHLSRAQIVQPVASAGATLHAIWLSGQFHGVMRPQTPIGSLTIKVVPRRASNS